MIDFCIFFFGGVGEGSSGDIESMPFIEALRQLFFSVGKPAFFFLFIPEI